MTNHSFIPSEQILFEDNHLIIINKKAGQIVQGDKSETIPLVDDLKEYVKHKYNKQGNVYMGLPHRLDRPTTGIVIFTKTSKALSRMVELFKKRDIKKTYWALVRNPIEKKENNLKHYLSKNSKNNKSTVFPKPTDGCKEARLHYKTIQELDTYSLVEVELETGRHHQIRAQMSFVGNPIKGDVKYGDKRGNADRSICLHARKIEFIHPVKKEPISITAPILSNESIWQAITVD